MKTVFIPAKYTKKADLSNIKLDKLPSKIGVVTTVQFLDQTNKIKNYLEKNGKEVFVGKGRQKNAGQILGCDVSATEKIKDKVEAFLYIGSGRFHPIGTALKTNKDVFCFNPTTNIFSKLDKKDIENYKKTRKAKYARFLHADNIGILVSTKPGQCSYKKAVKIKKKLEEKGKKCFIFVFNTLNANEMENFPFIDFWVNTACPRIADDEDKKNVIDMGELD
jgi:2-(3-amino-3-carboxypropyl)histidine synthase